MSSHDIILPPGAAISGVGRSRLVSFVPITVALFGVAAILIGGVSVRTPDPYAASLRQIDPITTGSIDGQDARRHALEMLDR